MHGKSAVPNYDMIVTTYNHEVRNEGEKKPTEKHCIAHVFWWEKNTLFWIDLTDHIPSSVDFNRVA